MTLGDLVEEVKREARYGDISDTSDQVTKDILRSVNKRRFRVWRFWSWDWSIQEISESIIAGTTDCTMPSTVGDILVLNAGKDNYLKYLTFKRYLRWFKRQDDTEGDVTHYVKLGRDSSNNLRVRLWRIPSASGTLSGWGKKRITAYTVANIATNTGLEYFPEEVQDILVDLVVADVLELSGDKPGYLAKLNVAMAELQRLVTEEENRADEEMDSPPPDFMVWRNRNRGGTTVV